VEYVPYTSWHLVQTLQLLSFAGLGFYLLRKKLVPEAKINLDMDYFYRLFGRACVALAKFPIAILDTWWGEVYRTLGLRGIWGLATGSATFDRVGIDGVVDGTAVTVREVGRSLTKVQSGRLQDYLGWAALVSLCVFAIVWYVGSR
jgi:multicomponent Na+:H+ antiporter subunit D